MKEACLNSLVSFSLFSSKRKTKTYVDVERLKSGLLCVLNDPFKLKMHSTKSSFDLDISIGFRSIHFRRTKPNKCFDLSV